MELIHVYRGGGTKELIWGRETYMCMGEGVEGINTCVWGKGDPAINACVWRRGIHVYSGGGTRELIYVCVEVEPSTICVCVGGQGD